MAQASLASAAINFDLPLTTPNNRLSSSPAVPAPAATTSATQPSDFFEDKKAAEEKQAADSQATESIAIPTTELPATADNSIGLTDHKEPENSEVIALDFPSEASPQSIYQAGADQTDAHPTQMNHRTDVNNGEPAAEEETDVSKAKVTNRAEISTNANLPNLSNSTPTPTLNALLSGILKRNTNDELPALQTSDSELEQPTADHPSLLPTEDKIVQQR